MKNTCFALVLSLLVFSCSNAPTSPTPTPTGIEGKWLWIQSSGGFTGRTTLTPEPGSSVIIEFRNDGKYNEYYNGSLSRTLEYELAKERSRSNHEMVDVVRLFEALPMSRRIQVVTADTLQLHDNYVDGFASIYTRVR